MSEESRLARFVIMSEVLFGKDVISVLHYTKTHCPAKKNSDV